MQVIYIVGVLKRRLHIPASCPALLRRLLAACWDNEPSDRPSFLAIVPLLEVGALPFCGHDGAPLCCCVSTELPPCPQAQETPAAFQLCCRSSLTRRVADCDDSIDGILDSTPGDCMK